MVAGWTEAGVPALPRSNSRITYPARKSYRTAFRN
jgi:hypothetical protein